MYILTPTRDRTLYLLQADLFQKRGVIENYIKSNYARNTVLFLFRT